jgi:hypothetical protein
MIVWCKVNAEQPGLLCKSLKWNNENCYCYRRKRYSIDEFVRYSIYTRMFEFLFKFLIVNDGLVGGRPLCRLILYTKVCSNILLVWWNLFSLILWDDFGTFLAQWWRYPPYNEKSCKPLLTYDWLCNNQSLLEKGCLKSL